MTNEQLIRQYYDGDDAALEKLYYKNIGLIRGIAKEAAAEFNCLTADPQMCIRDSQMPHRFQQIVQLCSRGKLRHLPADALQQIRLPICMVPQCIHVFHHSLPVRF